MVTMHIYRDNELIDVRDFVHRICITQERESKQLYWEADAELDRSRRGGDIQIWIRNTSDHPEIVQLLPPWRLIIDEMAMEQGVYYEIDVTGRKIELLFNNYKFVCVFPHDEHHKKSEIAAIRPKMKVPPTPE